MDEIVYSALSNYYHALGVKGYMPHKDVQKLLLLIFYRDFIYNDYRGLISRDDYKVIERALYCLYGSTCLIPYPDYLKMGKLFLGSLSEVAQRVEALEETNVVKLIHDLESVEGTVDSDVIIVAEE